MNDQTIPADKVREVADKYGRDSNVNPEMLLRQAIADLRALLPAPPQPTSGLFGKWAKHQEHGDVMCIWGKPDSSGHISVHWAKKGGFNDVEGRLVLLSELTFPHQATRPEDVPAGEAWRVRHCEGGEFNAVKTSGPFPWRFINPEIEEHDGFRDNSVTLIAPLTPERPASDLQAKYDELEQKYAELDRKYFDLSVELSIEQQANGSRNDWGDEQPSIPRTVTTPEEYDALPVGSQVRASSTAPIWQKSADGLWEADNGLTRSDLQNRDSRTVLRYGWGDEQTAWRIEAHNPDNFRVGEYIIDIDGDSGTVTPEWIELWDTDEDTFGARRFAPFIVFPNKDVATPEAIKEANKARDKEMDK